MTIKMYANRKGWKLDSAKVIMDHKKIYAEDCGECETKTGKIDYIDRQLYLYGDLDEDQRNRLLEIADRCPVHRTLHSEIVVKTKLLD
jgi:putative redox protein